MALYRLVGGDKWERATKHDQTTHKRVAHPAVVLQSVRPPIYANLPQGEGLEPRQNLNFLFMELVRVCSNELTGLGYFFGPCSKS